MNFRHLIKSDVVESKNYRVYLVLNSIAYLGSAVHILLAPTFFLGYSTLAILNIFSSIAWVYSWWINRLGYHATAVTLMIAEITIHTLMCVPIVGWDAGFQYYLIGSIPFVLFNYRLRTSTIIITTAFYFVLYSSLYGVYGDEVRQYAHPLIIAVFHYANILITFTAIGLASFYFRLSSILAEQELEKLVTTDPLTGLFNRRKMEELLKIQQGLAARSGYEVSLVLIDVDHFKLFNDTYGHECGDDVLRQVALTIQQRLRETDVIARWGGEEFLLMLPDTDLKSACVIAEELRSTVAAHQIVTGEFKLAITMKFGVAEHEVGGLLEKTLAQADEQLYRGKNVGRNCIMSKMTESPTDKASDPAI